MGPWEKLQLGWLDYTVVPFGKDMDVQAGPSGPRQRHGDQAVVIPLPERTVVTEHNTPHSGAAEWWSGFGNDISATLTRDLDLSGALCGERRLPRVRRHRGGLRHAAR